MISVEIMKRLQWEQWTTNEWNKLWCKFVLLFCSHSKMSSTFAFFHLFLLFYYYYYCLALSRFVVDLFVASAACTKCYRSSKISTRIITKRFRMHSEWIVRRAQYIYLFRTLNNNNNNELFIFELATATSVVPAIENIDSNRTLYWHTIRRKIIPNKNTYKDETSHMNIEYGCNIHSTLFENSKYRTIALTVALCAA